MEEHRRALRAYATSLILTIMAVIYGFTWVKLKDTQERLTELERGTSERMAGQQAQLDSLQVDIEGLASYTDAMMQDIENLDRSLQESRQVQKNTIGALTRLRKQKDELEKKLEEGLELRRQRLAEMMANRSQPSGAWSALGGVFELTAYAWSGDPCANGEWPVLGYTVASNTYPIGTRLYIEGIGERVVTDTGGMGGGVIDIYMGDPETCIQFGRQTAQVYVIED